MKRVWKRTERVVLMLVLLCLSLSAGAQTIFEAAAKGDLARVEMLVRQKPALVTAQEGSEGATALQLAARYGQTVVAQFLLANGANPNQPRLDASIALMDSAANNHVELTRMLLQAGAKINTRTTGGMTPLHYAAERGYPNVVKLLLESGAAINAQRINNDDWTPLHCAAWAGQAETMRVLLKGGADAGFRTSDGNLAIHKAAHNGQTGAIRVLIANGTDPNAPNRDGNTPLAVAAFYGQLNVGKFLLGVGADPTIRNLAGASPADEANRNGKGDFAALISAYQASIATRNARLAVRGGLNFTFRPGWQAWSGRNAKAEVVYRNDFATGIVGGEWTTAPLYGTQSAPLAVSVTPTNKHFFLGELGSQSAQLFLDNLPLHREISVRFDLYIIRSWDGNNAEAGPDIWSLRLTEGPTLLHTTFCNFDPDAGPNLKMQAFPGDYPGDFYPTRTGTVETDTLGFLMPVDGRQVPMDAVYKLAYTFGHSGKTLGLEFAAQGLQELGDESWGIANIEISVAAPADVHKKPTPRRIRTKVSRRRA